MKTTVVNKYKDKYDVYIGRFKQGSMFGNKFTVQEYGREKAIELYRKWFYRTLERNAYFKKQVLALKGKILGCYCKPKACHGDVIAEYLNSLE